ncbi:type II secretion system protein [Neptunomonas japonica]|uniref:type II secretion system protein n=1 Tax=Neptunomonas japonica TaxID=417574 RepID=UPI000688F9C9|nr:type II secretion system protein [Neptunomonas japonica]
MRFTSTSNRYRNTSGFTIIELVAVIAILSILSAVALPRFINIQNQSHEANVAATGAALSTAVVMARSALLASGGTGAVDNINFGRNVLDTNSAGWPVTTTDGLNVMTDHQGCVELWNALLQNPPSVRAFLSSPEPKFGASSDTFFMATKHGGRDQCAYFYRRAPSFSLEIRYDAELGTVTVDSNL